jgi:hypothetical protein
MHQSTVLSGEEYSVVKAILIDLNRVCQKVNLQHMETYFISKNIHIHLESLQSIQAQLFTRNMKYESRKSNEDNKMKVILADVGELTMFQSCCRHGYSSYKFAKNYLENLTGSMNSVVQTFLRDSFIIVKDERVRNELLECITNDPFNSFENDIMKQLVGKEYEELLIHLLIDRKMCFETEEELRNKGKPKTPDVVFLIPMIVMIQDEEHLVNWIDSKAMFADEETYRDSVEQFNSYTNRYGKGLVIYWLGFVSTITPPVDICISDIFPLMWKFPTGESADGRVPVFMEACS